MGRLILQACSLYLNVIYRRVVFIYESC